MVGRRRDGKYRYSESGKQVLIGLCQQSGASVSAIAVANGINSNVVRRWLSLTQVERASQNDQAPALLPVMVLLRSAYRANHVGSPCYPVI